MVPCARRVPEGNDAEEPHPQEVRVPASGPFGARKLGVQQGLGGSDVLRAMARAVADRGAIRVGWAVQVPQMLHPCYFFSSSDGGVTTQRRRWMRRGRPVGPRRRTLPNEGTGGGIAPTARRTRTTARTGRGPA